MLPRATENAVAGRYLLTPWSKKFSPTRKHAGFYAELLRSGTAAWTMTPRPIFRCFCSGLTKRITVNSFFQIYAVLMNTLRTFICCEGTMYRLKSRFLNRIYSMAVFNEKRARDSICFHRRQSMLVQKRM